MARARWRRSTDPANPRISSDDQILLLGIPIHRLRLSQLLELVRVAVANRHRTTVLYVNVHCMNVASRDASYFDILRRADIVYCDGTGVRIAARLAGFELPERMTGADWIHDLCRMAVREGLSLFLLGGATGATQEAASLLRIRYPGLRIVGTLPGFDTSAAAIKAINASGADILLVGMGTPTQEKWISEHRNHIEAPVVWAVGALFDFVSGRIPRGPRWMTNYGLEWVCRLTVEPGKLWKRYLWGNPFFFWRVIRRYWLGRP